MSMLEDRPIERDWMPRPPPFQINWSSLAQQIPEATRIKDRQWGLVRNVEQIPVARHQHVGSSSRR